MIQLVPANYIVSFVVIYVLGFMTGYLTRSWAGSIENNEVQKVVALFITFIWGVSFVATVTVSGYTTPIWIHGIMGAAAGFLFKGEGEITIPIKFK